MLGKKYISKQPWQHVYIDQPERSDQPGDGEGVYLKEYIDMQLVCSAKCVWITFFFYWES